MWTVTLNLDHFTLKNVPFHDTLTSHHTTDSDLHNLPSIFTNGKTV